MKKKVILHCGSPKTATSSLQAIFFSMKQEFLNSGIHYMERNPYKGEKYKAHQAFIHIKNGKIGPGLHKIQKHLHQEFHSNETHTALISNESIFDGPLMETSASFYPRAEELIPIIKEAFKDYDLHISFMLRNQGSFIPSYYTQRVRQGLTKTLDEYAADYDLENLSWTPFIELLRHEFGQDKVTVNCFENYCMDQQKTITALFPDLKEFTLVNKEKHKNQSASWVAHKIMRGLNLFMDILFGHKPDVRHKIQRHFRRVQFPIIERLFPGDKRELDADQKAMLSAIYEDDLKALGIRVNLGNDPS